MVVLAGHSRRLQPRTCFYPNTRLFWLDLHRLQRPQIYRATPCSGVNKPVASFFATALTKNSFTPARLLRNRSSSTKRTSSTPPATFRYLRRRVGRALRDRRRRCGRHRHNLKRGGGFLQSGCKINFDDLLRHCAIVKNLAIAFTKSDVDTAAHNS